MDTLQDWEVLDLYCNLLYADCASWEQTRWLMYVVALVNSRKQIKVTDLLRFPWEDGRKETTISTEDIQRLKEKAKLIQLDLLKRN